MAHTHFVLEHEHRFRAREILALARFFISAAGGAARRGRKMRNVVPGPTHSRRRYDRRFA
jgi:hypothetical protein